MGSSIQLPSQRQVVYASYRRQKGPFLPVHQRCEPCRDATHVSDSASPVPISAATGDELRHYF